MGMYKLSSKSMQAYSPYNGKKYETLSYLPQLSNDDIRKQIDYMIRNSWTPSLEFSDDGDVYLNTRMGPSITTTDIGRCTNCLCLVVLILQTSFEKSKVVRKNFQTLKSVLLGSTQFDKCKVSAL